jgi:hypothetical protein
MMREDRKYLAVLGGILAAMSAALLTTIYPHWPQDTITTYRSHRTANVQQVRETKDLTRIWMNDGTVWESEDYDARMLLSGDEISYQHVAPINAPQPPEQACYLIDRSRPGVAAFLAFRVVGDAAEESCPAGVQEPYPDSSQQRAEPPPGWSNGETPIQGRQLSKEEIEYYRKRNECEFRFMDKGIYDVDGKPIGEVCKESPDRKP